MGIKDTVEYLYLCFMAKWEKTAPLDQHKGLLDGEPERKETRKFQDLRILFEKLLLDRKIKSTTHYKHDLQEETAILRYRRTQAG